MCEEKAINALFHDLHGALDFEHVVLLKDVDKKQSAELARILNIDEQHIYHNKKGILHSNFFFNGLFFSALYNPKDIEAMQINSGKNFIKDSLHNSIASFNEMVENKEFVFLFDCVDKRILIKVYCDMYDKIPNDQKYEAFVNMYIRNETAFDTIPQNILDDLFNNQIKHSAERKKRIAELKRRTKNKKQFVVYHGVNGQYNPHDEMSWTLKIETAQFFADRFGNEGTIARKKTCINDVIDFFSQRNEDEVLLKVKK